MSNGNTSIINEQGYGLERAWRIGDALNNTGIWFR